MISPRNFDRSLPRQSSLRDISFDLDSEITRTYSKKRVGDYAYYLNDLIGSGYSSQVYKCHHRNDRQKIFAIKVIKLNKTTKASHQLLQNEIKILQGLDHPNIIKFHNVYYTENNCYIITDYCEGGTLQDKIDKNAHLNWEQLVRQLVSSCNYLANNLIIHRDIKPANVFLQNGQWKIGDFGFARYISEKDALVKQTYKVGSPVYMPPQTLNNNVYSLKTDSFALGIMLFYTITKRFPWAGKNRQQLLQSYQTKPLPARMLTHFPVHVQQTIIALCQPNIDQRKLIQQISQLQTQQNSQGQIKALRAVNLPNGLPESMKNIQVSQSQVNQNNEEIKKICQSLKQFDILQRIKICKFVNYIIKNIEKRCEYNALGQLLQKLLKLILQIFQWIGKQQYSKYVDEFNCKESPELQNFSQLKLLQKNINDEIKHVILNPEDKFLQTLRAKFIQLRYILKLIIKKQTAKFKDFVGKLLLHPDFAAIFMFPSQLEDIQKLLLY